MKLPEHNPRTLSDTRSPRSLSRAWTQFVGMWGTAQRFKGRYGRSRAAEGMLCAVLAELGPLVTTACAQDERQPWQVLVQQYIIASNQGRTPVLDRLANALVE